MFTNRNIFRNISKAKLVSTVMQGARTETASQADSVRGYHVPPGKGRGTHSKRTWIDCFHNYLSDFGCIFPEYM